MVKVTRSLSSDANTNWARPVLALFDVSTGQSVLYVMRDARQNHDWRPVTLCWMDEAAA